MKHICLLALVCLSVATAASAQVEIVSAVKNDLVARHVSLNGPCGAFEITKRVAWALRSQGYGLLSKPGGNNCQGYSVDYLTLADGSGYDILGDGGGENIPQFGQSEAPGSLLGRWVVPFDPMDAPIIVVPPVVVVPMPDLQAQILIALQAHEAAEAIERQEAKEFRAAVKSNWEAFGRPVLKFVGTYVAPALTTWLIARRVGK